MQKIKEIYKKAEDYVKDLFKDKQKAMFALVVVVAILAGFFTYQLAFKAEVNKEEFLTIMDEGIAYLDETSDIKAKYLNQEISKDEFNNRAAVIEDRIRIINDKLHNSDFDEIRIDKETIQITGEALEGLIAVIFQTEDLSNIEDEIIALKVILQDMKDAA